jgi:hypothetical protein
MFMEKGATDEHKPRVSPTGHQLQKALPRKTATTSIIANGRAIINLKGTALPPRRARKAPMPRPKVEMGSIAIMRGEKENATPAPTISGIA